jgi:hypothetical protein
MNSSDLFITVGIFTVAFSGLQTNIFGIGEGS